MGKDLLFLTLELDGQEVGAVDQHEAVHHRPQVDRMPEDRIGFSAVTRSGAMEKNMHRKFENISVIIIAKK